MDTDETQIGEGERGLCSGVLCVHPCSAVEIPVTPIRIESAGRAGQHDACWLPLPSSGEGWGEGLRASALAALPLIGPAATFSPPPRMGEGVRRGVRLAFQQLPSGIGMTPQRRDGHRAANRLDHPIRVSSVFICGEKFGAADVGVRAPVGFRVSRAGLWR